MKALLTFVLILLTWNMAFSQNIEEYVCFPCGAECDEVIHKSEGICSVCGMELISKERVVFKIVTPEEMAKMISSNEDIIILDVRTESEYNGEAGDHPEKKAGHIKNAINIPHMELQDRIGEIEQFKKRKIVVYCSRSHRSPYSSQILTDNGFTNVSNMAEGLASWIEKGIVNTETGESLIVK